LPKRYQTLGNRFTIFSDGQHVTGPKRCCLLRSGAITDAGQTLVVWGKLHCRLVLNRIKLVDWPLEK
jgi:hypothetical protein